MKKGGFHLDKWFLDFVGEEGETYIFYAAKLKWHRIVVPYTSIIHYDPQKGVNVMSRFKKVQMPQQSNNCLIKWSDPVHHVEGSWSANSIPIQQRIYSSGEGYLDWFCYQPASDVTLNIHGKKLKGKGYAEQLILTATPWSIPMDELRWGRFGSDAGSMVWIELKGFQTKSWLWFNGKQVDNFSISDNELILSDENIKLQLDMGVVLESENKIHSVTKNLMNFIPGFNKLMPLQFLMAEEHKWLSKGLLIKGKEIISNGYAIHELVNFKPKLTS